MKALLVEAREGGAKVPLRRSLSLSALLEEEGSKSLMCGVGASAFNAASLLMVRASGVVRGLSVVAPPPLLILVRRKDDSSISSLPPPLLLSLRATLSLFDIDFIPFFSINAASTLLLFPLPSTIAVELRGDRLEA